MRVGETVSAPGARMFAPKESVPKTKVLLVEPSRERSASIESAAIVGMLSALIV